MEVFSGKVIYIKLFKFKSKSGFTWSYIESSMCVADDAFPLTSRIMKSYPSRALSYLEEVFNYRLSRARRMIKSSFGILANRFRILLKPLNLNPDKVEK